MDIADVVLSLTGPVEPVGDSAMDAHRLENLRALCDVAGVLLDRIELVAEAYGEHMASVKAAKDHAAAFLRTRGVLGTFNEQEKNMELPDAIRVPLDELEADAAYIIGRVAADGSCSGIMVEAIRRRTRAIREALLAHGVMAAELTPEEFAREGVDLEREVQAISDQLRKERAAGVAPSFNDQQERP